MSSFDHRERKRSASSTRAAPTSHWLRPSRPLAPLPTAASRPVPPVTQAQLEHAARFGHSLERISLLPPVPRATEVNKAEQADAIATMQQAASPSVSAPSTLHFPEAIPIDEHTKSDHTSHFEYSFATTPLFPTVQRKAVLPTPLQEESQLGPRIQAARSSGHPLDKQTQQRLEQGLGTDLSSVRVHTDSEADHLSRSVNAKAFTTGPDIFFRSGMYAPSTQRGLHLLAHEVTHTLQQATGPVVAAPIGEGVAISHPDDYFEHMAEVTASRVMNGTSAPVQLKASAPARPQLVIQRQGGGEGEEVGGLIDYTNLLTSLVGLLILYVIAKFAERQSQRQEERERADTNYQANRSQPLYLTPKDVLGHLATFLDPPALANFRLAGRYPNQALSDPNSSQGQRLARTVLTTWLESGTGRPENFPYWRITERNRKRILGALPEDIRTRLYQSSFREYASYPVGTTDKFTQDDLYGYTLRTQVSSTTYTTSFWESLRSFLTPSEIADLMLNQKFVRSFKEGR